MVLQGSAAMSLRFVGICRYHFVANFVLNLAVKEFGKLISISRCYWHEWVCCFL